jgi:predicted phosphodiesterase
MRYLIISDIHANLTAFEAVLEDAHGEWDVIWCLGDIVGYGPDPNECVRKLREFDHIALSGNHDWAVLDRLDLHTFNEEAYRAILWTQDILKDENKEYLESLPSTLVQGEFTLAHGSPRQPVWEYLVNERLALENFKVIETHYCLVGHSHAPLIFVELNEKVVDMYAPVYFQPLQLDGPRLIINPGSVGQPRDYDPRAAYGLLNTDTMVWEHRRVEYQVEKTQERMAAFDLPIRLINRLQFGW